MEEQVNNCVLTGSSATLNVSIAIMIFLSSQLCLFGVHWLVIELSNLHILPKSL